MSDYEADEADVLEQSTPLLPSEDDLEEEYPNELEAEEPDEDDEGDDLDDGEVGVPEDPGITEG